MVDYEFKITQVDKDLLTKVIRNQYPSTLGLHDFTNTLIYKPWGYEYLFHENANKKSCGWMLHINRGYGTSMHCHHYKKTTLTVLSGILKFATVTGEFIIYPGDKILIDEGVFHSVGAVSDDAQIIELETPSYKPDAVRLMDAWDRTTKPYEEGCAVVTW